MEKQQLTTREGSDMLVETDTKANQQRRQKMRFEFEGSMEEMAELLGGSLVRTVEIPGPTKTRTVYRDPNVSLQSGKVESEAPAVVKESVLEPAWATAPAVSEPPVKRGRGRPKGSGKKTAEPAASPLPAVDDLLVEEEEEQDDETVEAEVEAEVETPATKADLTYALEKLIGSRGVPVAKTLLGEFGVAKLGDLSEKFYGSFLKRAMELGS
jgi:hypothetical protein